VISENSVETVRRLVVQRMIERLQSDYMDFIEGVEGFSEIPEFFRDYLYSPPNKETRDAALEQLYGKLKSITGPEMTENIHKLIQLIQISDDLDRATAKALLEGPLQNNPEAHASISSEELEEAIVRAGGYENRKRQIELICETLSFFFALSKLPFIKLVMAPIRVAANLVGAQDLVSTMEKGYQISRGIKDMKPFITAFREREMAYLERLWSRKVS
jgi:hypothetical protein